MNWVFWFTIDVLLVLIWFACPKAWTRIGEWFENMTNNAKEELMEDNENGNEC